MYLDAAEKQEIFGKYGKSNSDTGSTEAQIALFSYRISHLTEQELMMDFVAVKLKIIAGLGGWCGEYQRGVEYVQAKCATRDQHYSGGISVQQKGTLRVAGPASQGDKPSLLDSALSLGPS